MTRVTASQNSRSKLKIINRDFVSTSLVWKIFSGNKLFLKQKLMDLISLFAIFWDKSKRSNSVFVAT